MEVSRKGLPMANSIYTTLDGKTCVMELNGRLCLFSARHRERVEQFHWYASKKQYTYYVKAPYYDETGKRRLILLHRFILNPPDHLEVDHWDHNGLNNLDSNIRPCTHLENMQNRKIRTKGNSCQAITGHYGISPRHQRSGYLVSIMSKGLLHRKCCKTLEQAISERDKVLKGLGWYSCQA